MPSNTVQGVSAALRKGGCIRSVSASSRIRGFQTRTEGYRAEHVPINPHYAGLVSHCGDRRYTEEEHKAILKGYEDALVKAGYKVEYGTFTAPTDKGGHYMWVSVA